MKLRINKYISEAGICSRREADRKIKSGRVKINGRRASLGDHVDDSDDILVDGNPIHHRVERVYLAYNKPVGVTSTTDRSDPDNIIKAVGYHGGRIFTIGRLDKDSDGLILLTNDGDIVNKILRVSNEHDKEYIVTVDKPIDEKFTETMSNGVSIMGVMTRKCDVELINDSTFRIVLNQGLNRQIRRMCKALGYRVTSLRRTRIMNITLAGIPTGTWRFLSDKEISSIMNQVSDSSKTSQKGGKFAQKKRPQKAASVKKKSQVRNKRSQSGSSEKSSNRGSRGATKARKTGYNQKKR